MAIEVKTSRLLLRRPELADAPAIQRIASDPRVALYTATVPHPYPPDGATEFIRNAIADRNHLRLAITLTPSGQTVGTIGAQLVKGAAELGYMVDPEHWGRGIATEAVAGLVEHLLASSTAEAIVATTMAENVGSQRVLRTVGFVRIGERTVRLPVRGGTYHVIDWRFAHRRGESRDPD